MALCSALNTHIAKKDRKTFWNISIVMSSTKFSGCVAVSYTDRVAYWSCNLKVKGEIL